MIANIPVLVLNQNYEPLNVCSARRALLLIMSEKAEVLESGIHVMRSPSVILACPSVIRLQHLIKRPRRGVQLSRREVFVRDDYTCQYCGTRTRDLTLDHVIPRSKGGPHTWDNLVSACYPCNHRKGQRTPEQARMRLARLPREPRVHAYHMAYGYLRAELREDWLVYLPGLAPSN